MSFKQTFNNYYAGNENGIERAGNIYTGAEYNCCLDTEEKKELRALHKDGEHLGAPTSNTGSLKYNTDRHRWEVRSYWTIVGYFAINKNGKWTFHRTWEGFSRTTLSQINNALDKFLLPSLSKKEWLTLPVEEA